MNQRYQGCLGIKDMTYGRLREQLGVIADENRLKDERVAVVCARTLTAEESIGKPDRQDYPLIIGREVMVAADFMGVTGQAFTDMPGDFKGSVRQVLDLTLSDNFERAVFIATLNAILRHLDCINCTIHCRDKEPEECASHLVDYVGQHFGTPKIAFIGLQPAMVDHLGRHYEIRVTDMDFENHGKKKCGVLIEPPEHTREIIEWGDLVFATGSTVVNDTYRSLIQDRPLVFYGVTVSGIAYLSGCHQYCDQGH